MTAYLGICIGPKQISFGKRQYNDDVPRTFSYLYRFDWRVLLLNSNRFSYNIISAPRRHPEVFYSKIYELFFR